MLDYARSDSHYLAGLMKVQIKILKLTEYNSGESISDHVYLEPSQHAALPVSNFEANFLELSHLCLEIKN